MSLPGLSVWLWGPTLWEMLHFIAKANDSGQLSLDPRTISMAFQNIGDILPCVYCRASYAPFYAELARARPVELVIREKNLQAFVYNLHNLVNKKLARQRWQRACEEIRRAVGEDAFKLISSAETAEIALPFIDKYPSLAIVQKKATIFEREPFYAEAVFMICTILASRQKNDAFFCFLSVFIEAAKTVHNDRISEMTMALESSLVKMRRGAAWDTFADSYIRFTSTNASFVSKEEFLGKLSLFNSSGCSSGSCH